MKGKVLAGVLIGALISAALVLAFNQPRPVEADERPSSGLVASELPLNELMGHVVQQNAERIWAWTETKVDKDGEHSGLPKSAEQWELAEGDALTLQQLTYSIANSKFRVDDPRWQQHAARLREAATASAKAAELKDGAALSKAGNEIDAQCVQCHLVFAPQLETLPNGQLAQ